MIGLWPLASALLLAALLLIARDAYRVARDAPARARRPLAAIALGLCALLFGEVLLEPLTLCVARGYRLLSGAMVPALLPGEHVRVSPFVFGARYQLRSLDRTLRKSCRQGSAYTNYQPG